MSRHRSGGRTWGGAAFLALAYFIYLGASMSDSADEGLTIAVPLAVIGAALLISSTLRPRR